LQIILVVGAQRLDSPPSRSLEQRIADPRLGYHCLERDPPEPVRPSLPMLRPRLSEAEPRLQRLDPLAPDPRHFPRLIRRAPLFLEELLVRLVRADHLLDGAVALGELAAQRVDRRIDIAHDPSAL